MSGKRVAKKPKKKIKKRTLFMISSELTVAWFSAWTVELALLFGIKIKDKSSEDEAAG